VVANKGKCFIAYLLMVIQGKEKISFLMVVSYQIEEKNH
jgi:hypothetical protein